VAEGVEVVACGLDAGAVPEAIFVAAEAERDPQVASVLAGALGAGTRVFTLGPGVADKVADTVTPHPLFGIFAMTDVALEALARPSLAVACVDVRDPGNAGTVLRTCDAAGVDAVLFCAGSVDPFNPKTVRSSAGSIFHVPLAVVPETARALAWLRAAGVSVFGTAASGTDYLSADLRGPCAFVLGNEKAGLAEGLLGTLDGALSIPMAGRAESLNVGIACAVFCFEAARQRR
jgi:RNA methyltransferase, TrmH family